MGLWDVDKIEYVGRAKGPKEDFAFHYYDADKVVAGKKMKDWLRFGVAWWHTFNQELVDPFGTGTAHRPYYKYTDPMDQALAKVDYAFELFQKLGVEYFCFHDRDIAPEGDTLRETNANLDKVVDKIDENMKSTGVNDSGQPYISHTYISDNLKYNANIGALQPERKDRKSVV